MIDSAGLAFCPLARDNHSVMLGNRGSTLYELLHDPSRAPPMTLPPHQPREPVSTPIPPEAEPRWKLHASRVVRVPTGYLFIGAGVALAVIALAYSIGFTAGQHRRDRLDAQRLAAGRGDRAALPIHDPLLEEAPQQFSAPTNGVSPASKTIPSISTTGDPRIEGMNYYVVAYYGPELAQRAAVFLRDHGVDATVVMAHNGRFRFVISLKPFPPGTMASAEARDHEALLKRLGRIWKRDYNGPDDFSEVWAQKYRPPRSPADGR